jgi:multiple sugar transport system substrate-binding protein
MKLSLVGRGSVSALALVAMSGIAIAQDAKTIQIATHYTPAQAAPILECFATYEAEHPGIKIEHQQASYGDFLQTILTSRVGGTSPDIYNIYSIWAPQLASAGALEVPPQDVVDFITANYSQATIDAATIDGQLYGIPTELSVYDLIYNKKLLAEAGYDAPPKTWAELKEIAAKITKKNDQGNITVGGYAYGPSVSNAVHVFYAQMYAAGVKPYADDFRSTNLKSPEAVAILEQQADLFAEGITSNSITVTDFPTGAVGMAIMANWQKSNFATAFGSEFENTVGVASIPTDGPGGTMLYSFMWAVDSTSDVKAESWELLKWLNTAQTAGGLSCTGAMLAGMGALTGNNADLTAMGSSVSDFFTGPFVAEIESGKAVSQPNLFQASQVDRILRSYIEQAWAGTMSATDALTSADAEIQALMDEQP